MENNLIFYPNEMGKNLKLEVSFITNELAEFKDSVIIDITCPNLCSTEPNDNFLFLKTADNIDQFLCSTEVIVDG